MQKIITDLHLAHIIHRDIKPNNIIVFIHPHTQAVQTTLIDFGMSIKASPQTKRHANSRRDNHIESDHYLDFPFYDHRVDLWALGITAIELTTQKKLADCEFSMLPTVNQAQFDLMNINEQYHRTYVSISKLEILSNKEKIKWLLANSQGYTAESELIQFILTHTAPSLRSAKII